MQDHIPQTHRKQCSICGEFKPATREYFSPDKHSADRLEYRCKVCNAARAKRQREENPERYKASKRRFRESHKVEISEYNREYQVNLSPEKKHEYGKRYYWKHRDILRVKAYLYRDANIEEIREYDRERGRTPKRLAKNREYSKKRLATSEGKLKQATRVRNRRALLRAARGTHTPEDIRLLLKTQHNRCWWCGGIIDDEYHVDHRIPISRGGTNHASNLCIACPHCNWSKNNKMPWEWNGRLL